MAMHSYLRPNQSQTQTSNNPEQMHSFLKDKQAWEHAISLYQGPDPLDHWYNYICWYENHSHSDPENKFRETLERCLTVYEHNDYYRQDARLVRLWLKYIAMQTEPLHFYQVLFQRGTGRQVAAFYIGWASYYESREEYKDAEAVFNLAFQEKAQSNAELQDAHTKFTYARSLHYQQQAQLLHQAAQPPPPPQDALQQLATYTQTHHQQQQQQAQQQLPQSYAQPQQQYQPAPQQPQHIYHQTQYPQHPHELPAQQQQQAAQHGYHQQQHPHQAQQAHYQHQRYEQQLTATEAATHHPHAHTQSQPAPSPQQQQQQQHYPHVLQHNQLTPATSHYEPAQQQQSQQIQTHQQQLQPQASVSHHQQQQQQQHHQQQLQRNGNSQSVQSTSAAAAAEAAADVSGLRLPRNFHAYGRNNHETWKPALTLEEPDDPCRVCHYPKQLVYPQGAFVEYSPEELEARKYIQLLEQKRNQQANDIVQEQQQQQQLKKETLTYTTGALQPPPPPQQQQQSLYDSYESEASYYMTAVDGSLHAHNNSSSGFSYNGTENTEAADEEVADDAAGHKLADEDDNDDDDDDDAPEESDEEEEEEDQAEEDGGGDETDDAYTNGNDSYGIKFSAQTTFEQQSRSIKIKFKKERTAGNGTLDSSTYSAYTIESICHQQQEQPLPASPKLDAAAQRHRNGHHFHPYLLGQTSTPKSECSANGYKRARGKVKRSKFQAELCSNSNSSSSHPLAELMLNGEASAKAAVAAAAAGANAAAVAAAAAAATPAVSIHNATFNDNANFSFSSAAALDNSNSSLASAVDRLNFRDVSHVSATTTHNNNNNNKTLQVHNNNNTNNNNNHNATTTALADFSTFQENSYFATQHDTEAKERRLSKALETIERHMAKEAIDPFNSELCRAFLAKLDFPGDDAHASYKIVQTPLPKISNTRTLNVLDGVQFSIDKEVGRGSYGSVYKATDTRTGNVVALKFQKPPNTWEIYICDQVLKRITAPEVLPGLMDISTAIIAPNASLIATEFSPFGSLLDINNKIRQATTKVMHESLVMHFSAQICNIVDHLHRQRIIHADIKPDNFLLMRVPSVDSPLPSLRLIDFGCAIDISLFPSAEHTKFRKVVQTDGFTCIEMQEGRPWSFETDLFCIAGTVHVMLFGEYMQPLKRAATWDIRQKLPRYLKKHVWSRFFGELLNMEPSKLPDLQEMKQIFEEECYRMDSELQKQIRTLSNILHRR